MQLKQITGLVVPGEVPKLDSKTFDFFSKIKSKSAISDLLKTGHRVKCPSFTIIFKKNSLNSDRLGVIVSRRTGNAVKRNKLKRISRELFRNNRLNIPPFFDVLIKPRPELDKEKSEISKECYNKWQQELKKR